MTLAQTGGREVAPWDKAGIHGVPRPRKWDAVVRAEADLPGDAVHFVALEDRSLIVDEDVPDDELTPLAEAVETQLEPPYRAEATRRGDRLWAVGATKIDDRDDRGRDRRRRRSSWPSRTANRASSSTARSHSGCSPASRRLAAGMPSYVVRADRIDGDLWEVQVAPL